MTRPGARTPNLPVSGWTLYHKATEPVSKCTFKMSFYLPQHYEVLDRVQRLITQDLGQPLRFVRAVPV